jgi:hypothetical protein
VKRRRLRVRRVPARLPAEYDHAVSVPRRSAARRPRNLFPRCQALERRRRRTFDIAVGGEWLADR